MSAKRLAFAISATFLLASSLAPRVHAEEAPGGTLGKVSFPTSCAPAVQPTFDFPSVSHETPKFAISYGMNEKPDEIRTVFGEMKGAILSDRPRRAGWKTVTVSCAVYGVNSSNCASKR